MKLIALMSLCWSVSVFANDTVYQLGSKEFKKSDLSPQLQQQMYEVEMESYEKKRQLVENSMFDAYVTEQAAKKKQNKDEVVKSLLKIAPVKDAEVKAWYEKNRQRVPYPFEQIKGEITKFLENEKREEKRQEWLKKFKDENKFALKAAKPAAPVVEFKNISHLPVLGSKDAKVAIVEFADYQCPHCKAAAAPLKETVLQLKDKVKYVYVDFPINPSGVSKIIAQGAYCAGKKDKFWEYNKAAFEKSPNVDNQTPMAIAKELGLDEKEFKKCTDSDDAAKNVAAGKTEGDRVGVSGTPAIFINGKRFLGGHTAADFKKAIEEELASGA